MQLPTLLKPCGETSQRISEPCSLNRGEGLTTESTLVQGVSYINLKLHLLLRGTFHQQNQYNTPYQQQYIDGKHVNTNRSNNRVLKHLFIICFIHIYENCRGHGWKDSPTSDSRTKPKRLASVQKNLGLCLHKINNIFCAWSLHRWRKLAAPRSRLWKDSPASDSRTKPERLASVQKNLVNLEKNS